MAAKYDPPSTLLKLKTAARDACMDCIENAELENKLDQDRRISFPGRYTDELSGVPASIVATTQSEGVM